MAKVLQQGRQVSAYDDLDLDELLSKLTPEEIEELNNEMDPDNSLLPPSQRCKDQTTKLPTGNFDREKLLHYLEEKAKNEKDWEQNKPYVKEQKGKKFVPKIQEAAHPKDELSAMGFEVDIDLDIDSVLKNASEEELVDLAAVLGFTGMLTQEQVQASLGNKPQEFGGFHSVTKHEQLKLLTDEAPNKTDVKKVFPISRQMFPV
jgi:tropomodulin